MNNSNDMKSGIRIDIITAHPKMFESVFGTSIIKIAQEKNLATLELHNLHDYADNKYQHIDDEPYGGGAGMIIQCQPVFDCIDKLLLEREYDQIIFMTPDAKELDQGISNWLSLSKNLIIIAGHYKGIDQRIRDRLVTLELSIGSYVLSGGELPAMILVDSIVRLIPGVLGDEGSALNDSFQDGLLEAPQYTRPVEFRGMRVPEILLKGNHKNIENWRLEQSIEKTQRLRPDLLDDSTNVTE